MKRLPLLVCAAAVLLCAALFSACTGEEGEVREKYAREGFVSYACTADDFGADAEQTDFVYYGVKDANTASPAFVCVITFGSLDAASAYEEDHSGDADKPNMRRAGRAVIFGDKSAVDMY